MEDAAKVIEQDHPGRGASAFVEDSVLLGGSPRALDTLCELLEARPLPIEFGAQLTVDQVLRREQQLTRLARVGLRYLFIGLETIDPAKIGGMSKDIGSTNDSWESRSKQVFETLARNKITCGCALLFGLGEAHESRLALLDTLIRKKRETGSPAVISANWAVQHPLKESRCDYVYLDWGTPAGPYLELFHNFGEASLKYQLTNQKAPKIKELQQIVRKLHAFERSFL